MTPRKTLRIARWELSKNAEQVDRRTLVVVGVAFVVVALLGGSVVGAGVTIDHGIYRVGVAHDSAYYPAVAQDPKLAVVVPGSQAVRRGRVDVLLEGNQASIARSAKGRAAYAEFRTAVRNYNNRLMATEPDQNAAFPVHVSLVYVSQDQLPQRQRAGFQSDSGTGTSGASGSTDGTGAGSTGGASAGDGGTGGTTSGGAASGGVGAPSFGSGALGTGGGRSGTPANISPPFPFQSLVLAFAFILPMNFVIQAYASSVIGERLNRRGELLLVSPVSRGDVVAGKTLPYLVAMLVIASVTAVAIGGGLVAIAAVLPIALVFLATGFVGGMFARSFKELTFVTVAASVGLTAYVFVPAVFTNVHPIALISPLTLVVQELQGTAVSFSEYAFSTTPFYLSAGVLFALGMGVYREEDMFTQRPVHLKALDALVSQLHRRRSVAKLSVLFIPFVFVAELLAVAVLFVFPTTATLPVLLVIVALVEETAKSVHVYAGFAHGTFDRSLRMAVVLGALSGAGFFLGEKLTLLAQLVGLPNLTLGRAAFGAAGAVSVHSPVLLAGLFLAPLALHTVTASLSSVGASKGTRTYFAGFLAAVMVHVVYNYAVVSLLG